MYAQKIHKFFKFGQYNDDEILDGEVDERSNSSKKLSHPWQTTGDSGVVFFKELRSKIGNH